MCSLTLLLSATLCWQVRNLLPFCRQVNMLETCIPLSTGQHARKLIPYLNTFNTLEMFPTYFYGNHSQFTVKLSCPHCLMTSITNQLHTTRWKDERTLYDKPHKLYCIQRNVLLVTSSLSLHKWRPNLASWSLASGNSRTKTSLEIPFVLFHKSRVTRDLFLYIFTYVQAGIKGTLYHKFGYMVEIWKVVLLVR